MHGGAALDTGSGHDKVMTMEESKVEREAITHSFAHVNDMRRNQPRTRGVVQGCGL